MKHFLITFFLLFLLACKPAVRIEALSYNEHYVDKSFDEYVTLFISQKNWRVTRDENSILFKNKQQGNITTLFVKAIRLSGNITHKNFAESLMITQAFNGANIESFSKTKLKNGKISNTEIVQDDFTILITTISKNDVGYVFVCMGTEGKMTAQECDEVFNLVHIR